jgi:quinol monooxygenase YgiN
VTDAPATIVAYERWASRADWERHLQGEHVTSFMAVFGAILAGPPQNRSGNQPARLTRAALRPDSPPTPPGSDLR